MSLCPIIYLLYDYKNFVLIRKRNTNDIWQQLFEVPLVETTEPLPRNKQLELYQDQYGINDYEVIEYIDKEQKLTHQHLYFGLYQIALKSKKEIPGFEWIHVSTLDQFAFPKTLQWFIGHVKK